MWTDPRPTIGRCKHALGEQLTRYYPWVCHACGDLLVIDWRSGVFPSDWPYVCIECTNHYCPLCFVEHMLAGHRVELGRSFDLFDFQGEP
jgi:hypothetical protein